MHKITLLLGIAIGYVLGARAGRARYEEIVDKFETLKESPKTQEVAQKVQDRASEAASSLKESVTEVTNLSGRSSSKKSEEEKAEGNQSTAAGAPSSGAAPGGLDPLAGPKGNLP